MMRCAGVIIGAACLLAIKAVCFGQSITSSEIISQAKALDGKDVAYNGEVIGEVMQRGSHAWINVSDGANAIGVWLPVDLAKQVSVKGDFKHTGDMVEVLGVLNRACPEHGGDLDIHAESLRIIRQGEITRCGLTKDKKDWVIKLLGVLAIIWILSLLKTR